MNNKSKKHSMAFGLGLVAALVAVFQMSALAANPKRPKDANSNGPFDNTAFVGVKVCRLERSTTSKSCATAAGQLYALCASGTASVVGKLSMAFDTAVAAHTTLSSTGQKITPVVYATATTGPGLNVGCWQPPHPARFESGLGLVQDDSGHDTLGYYRLDDGSN